MEYDEEDNSFGDMPECGAIFMLSGLTMKECFKHHIFALPSSKASFVKHIKVGMLLFLFEFKKRQLFGVFEATSDGAMDIVPDGFYCSGRYYPAQVCFKTLWCCHPLNEKDFGYAIRENYVSSRKFKFGLSEVQVGRLLNLFSSRKTKKNFHPRLPREVNEQEFAANDRVELSERGLIEYDDHNPSALSDYRSMIRAKEGLMADAVVNVEEKIYHPAQDFLTNYHDDFLSKRRRLDFDDRLLMNDERDYVKYDDHMMVRPMYTSSSHDPMEVRKLVDGPCSSTIDKGYEENYPVMGMHAVDSLEAKGTNYGRLMHTNRFFSDSNMDDGLDQPYAKRLSKNYPAIDDNTVLHDSFARDYVTLDHFKPIVSPGHEIFHRSDDYKHLINGKLESRYQVCNDNIAVSASEEFHKHLHRTRTAPRDIFQNSEDMEFTSVNGMSSNSFLRQLECESSLLYDRKVRAAEGRGAGNTVDSILCSTTSFMDSGHISTAFREDFGDKSLRSSNRLENAEDHALVSPAISKYSLYSQPKQSFLSDRSVLPNYNSFNSAPDDTTISRAARHIPGLPNTGHGLCASAAADWKSCLGQETHLCHGSPGNSYSLSNSSSSPFLLHKSSRSIEDELGGGIRVSEAKASMHQSSLRCGTMNSHHNSSMSVHRAQDITTVNCGVPVPPQFSLPSLPRTSPNIREKKGLAAAYPRKSSESLFGTNGHLQVASPEHVPFSIMDVKDFPDGAPQPARDLSSYGNVKESGRVSEAPETKPSNIRISVFDRLKPAKNVGVGEDCNRADANSDNKCMDASTDEVMENLHQLKKHLPLRWLKDSKVVQPENVKSCTDLSHSVDKKDQDSHLESAEGTGKLLKETRIVGFKRRSDKKKGLVETKICSVANNDISVPEDQVENPARKILKREDEVKVESPAKKRRRLVRPDFTKTKPALEQTSNAALQPAELPRVIDDKQTSEKSICISDCAVLNVDSCMSNGLPSLSHDHPNGNKNDPCCFHEVIDVQCHVLASSRDDIEKRHSASSTEVIQTGTALVHHDDLTRDKTCGLQNSTGLLSEEVDLTMKSVKQDCSVETPKLDSGLLSEKVDLTMKSVKQDCSVEMPKLDSGLLPEEVDLTMKSVKQDCSVETPKLDSSSGTLMDGQKVKFVVERIEQVVRTEEGQDPEKDKEICESTVGMAGPVEVPSLKNCEGKAHREDRKLLKLVKPLKIVQGQDYDPEMQKEACETSQGKNKPLRGVLPTENKWLYDADNQCSVWW